MSDELFRTAEVRHAHAAARLAEDRAAFRTARRDHAAALEAQQVIQEIAGRVQQVAHRQICGLVSRCLRAVYLDEAYEFSIRTEKKRGKTEVKFVFARGGEAFDEPVGEIGMGVVEVANFALTLAEVVMTGKRRLLVMDEYFRGVHGDGNRERLARLLPALCRELDFQMVLCTGHEWLAESGARIEVKK